MAIDSVVSTIRKAEQEIRGHIAEAATAGKYELVSQLSNIAQRLSAIAHEATSHHVPVMTPPTRPIVAGIEPPERPVPPLGRKASGWKSYPRFERTRDALVKIGWSKKERSEYVHKAPKSGVDAVTLRVSDLGKGDRLFTTEDLLPVKLGSGDEVLPGYQVYICLAWLRDIGAVEQHGREGYSLPQDDLTGIVDRTWKTLPVSRR